MMKDDSINDPLTTAHESTRSHKTQQKTTADSSPLLVTSSNPDQDGTQDMNIVSSFPIEVETQNPTQLPFNRQSRTVIHSSTPLTPKKKNDTYQYLSPIKDVPSSEEHTIENTKIYSIPSLSSSSPPPSPSKQYGVGIQQNLPNEKNPENISLPSEPLSWREARKRMREILQQYLDNVSNERLSSSSSDDLDEAESNELNCLSSWCKVFHQAVKYNLDCYCGSILLSIVMLIMSISFYLLEDNSNYDTGALQRKEYLLDIHKSYIVTSGLCTILSILSLWAIRRRNYVSKYDIHLKRRRNVSSLLETLKKLEVSHEQADSYPYIVNSPTEGQSNQSNTAIWDQHIPGNNALSDIYDVYRLSSTSEQSRAKGEWHKIPSLLLVKGDFVALQTGDTAPTDCKMVTSSRFGSLPTMNHQSKIGNKKMSAPTPTSREGVVIKRGEIIPPPVRINQQRCNAQSLTSWFPPGKSTLPENSRKLLHLCNNKRVFEVQESPMYRFLQSQVSSYQSPQVHRQLWEIRSVMFFTSIVLFFLTSFVVATRYGINGKSNPHHFYLPFIAALSATPIITPLIIFAQEIIGTARILQFIHPMSSLSIYTSGENVNEAMLSKPTQLFLQYFTQGICARLGFFVDSFFQERGIDLIDFPPISMCLFEKLGNVTATAFIDDELICEPTLTPEQLLIPSSTGLKLLDLFPKHEDIEEFSREDDESSDQKPTQRSKSFRENTLKRFLSSASDDDSDSDWDEEMRDPTSFRRGRILSALKQRMVHRRKNNELLSSLQRSLRGSEHSLEVQFEDPSWWRFLPSLKCIGLSCLVLEEYKRKKPDRRQSAPKRYVVRGMDDVTADGRFRYFHGQAESALVNQICQFHERKHLRLLSQCIGFSMESNPNGIKGDFSNYIEQKRLHVVATRLLQQRVQLNRNAVRFEQKRTWGLLKPDSTSIVIRDNRSGANQLLTLGQPNVIIDFCTESWQGEISTIIPLSSSDRKDIIESTKSWKLADLDVTAFSYAPLPQSQAQKLETNGVPEIYLVDNRSTSDIPSLHQSEDWSILKNQIFLGLLGSSVSPRRFISHIIKDSDNAGVRFVYFSSRNLRRTKEVAIRMGIDVAWNSAISLQPLDNEDANERMKEDFNDSDFNAKLPHGVEAVIRHLEDVDNVPLLVRLYTDVTKKSTTEMVKIFRQHSDTVLSIGLAHNSHNAGICMASDLSIGVDLLVEDNITESKIHVTGTGMPNTPNQLVGKLCPEEVQIVSLVAANACVFNIPLGHSLTNLPFVIDKGRTCLNSVKSAFHFLLVAYSSFGVMTFFSTCSVSQSLPHHAGEGAALSLLLVIPTLALAMAFSGSNEESISTVAMKNKTSENFDRGERLRLFIFIALKASFPAVLSQLVYLISFGSILIELDSEIMIDRCGMAKLGWTKVLQCDALKSYIGPATTSAGAFVVIFHTLCIIAMSATFLQGSNPINSTPSPVRKNKIWIMSVVLCLFYVVVYSSFSLESGAFGAIPWYLYLFSFASFFLCVVGCELVKRRERKHEVRAAKMRRLHFETRLGMWSPKANQ